MEISLALMEASLEQAIVECDLITWTHGGLTDREVPEDLLATHAEERMHVHVAMAKGVSSKLIAWAYCLLLLLLGIVLNSVLGCGVEV
jgi:hypothetical protein